MIRRVHHVGIAVRNLRESAAFFQALLSSPARYAAAPCGKASEAVFSLGQGAEFDLLEPTGPETTVGIFLKKRGEGLHHLAFEVDDIGEELKAMAAKGFTLIDETGREGVAGQIGFLHPKSLSGLLTEFVEPRGRV